MNNKTDSNLAFWIEWVQLTYNQKEELLSHIHDNNILAEIVIHDASKGAQGVSCDAIQLIDDNEVLLDIAGRVCTDDLLENIADKLDPRTPELFRRFLNIKNVIVCMTFSSDLLDSWLRCVSDIDELINHYSNHTSFAIRRGVFDIIMEYLAGSEGAEHSRYLKVLQDMATAEPYVMSREYMCHKLDRIIEDSI